MTKPFNARWNKNTKLTKTSGVTYNVIGFGIPADYNFETDGVKYNTCPGALACRGVCYAKQGTYNFPLAKASRQHNLAFSQSDGFIAGTVADLKRMRKINTVRIHDSGDFYSQDYLNKWSEVAKALPHLTFYAYTKSLHLNLSGIPENFKITQSLGGKHDNLVNLATPHSRIFSSPEARNAAGYMDGDKDDSPAIEGEINIGFVYHGTRNLTESQKVYFG